MKQPDEKVVHGSTRTTLTRGDLKRSLPVVVVALLLFAFGWIGYTMYAQLNPAVSKFRQSSPIDSISLEDTNYSEMTKEQIDLQLKRQVGISVADLKQKTLTKGVFGTYDKAYKSAKALLAYGDRKKALEVYGIIGGNWTNKLDYNFYTEYAYVALDDNNTSLALEQLKLAKPKIDAIRSEETKEEVMNTYRLMNARAGGAE